MTTIAYRDGILAADTRMTLNDAIDGTQTKILKRGPVLAAASGTAAMCRAFRDWVAGGMVGDPPEPQHPTQPDWTYWGMLITPSHFALLQPAGWLTIHAPYFAAGSGGDLATGAMAMGATAEQAVRCAMLHDCKTGGDITAVRH